MPEPSAQPPPEIPARAWAEVDLAAICTNAEAAVRSAGVADIIAVVKANGYGHGAVPVGRALDGAARYLGVAGVAEAAELQDAGIKATPFILGTCLPEERSPAVARGCAVSASSLEELDAFQAAAESLGGDRHAEVHLVIDTGMGRIGFPEEELRPDEIAEVLRRNNRLDLGGIATHFPSADEDRETTLGQARRFAAHLQAFAEAGVEPRWVHLANSAGALDYPELKKTLPALNLARPGLMLYGASPLPQHQDELAPALTLKSRVTTVRDLPAGHGISYGADFTTTRPTRVATVAIGYGDGLPRSLSGSGFEVLVGGGRRPLLGRVTMDQIMIDGGAGEGTGGDQAGVVEVGDEVVLIGSQGADQITVAEVAEAAGTIPWEIFTGITPRVKRIYPHPDG